MCGVYYLTDGLDVIYVGSSINVEQRIRSHTTIDFSQVFVDQCDKSELLDREAAAIREFNPPLNERNALGLAVRRFD